MGAESGEHAPAAVGNRARAARIGRVAALGAERGGPRAAVYGLRGREWGKGNLGASAVGERRIWVTYVFTMHDAYREMRPAFGLAPLESVLGDVEAGEGEERACCH